MTVLLIVYRDQGLLSTHCSAERAWTALVEFVDQTWTHRHPELAPPQDEADRVSAFFNGGTDLYAIGEAEIEVDGSML